MARNKSLYQVIIIGGGPAGIATSLTLTSRGVSNCIVEAKMTPSAKHGEAIPPNAKPLLEKLGLKNCIDHVNHSPYYGNKSCWGSDVLEQKEFIENIYGHGYLLDRLYFEKQLRNKVVEYGGDTFWGFKLKEIVQHENGVDVTINNGENVKCLQGNYIVDATGRKASVAKQMGGEKQSLDEQFALTFRTNLSKEIERQITVEATENGWWYAAPQGTTELIVMFFTVKRLIPAKELIPAFITKELSSSLHISKLVSENSLDFDQFKIIPAGTSRLGIPYGKNWLAVGDAAYSYDPISSYGITSSLASGFYGGHAIASDLNNEEDALMTYRYLMEKTFEKYMLNKTAHYEQEKRWGNSIYWKNIMDHVS